MGAGSGLRFTIRCVLPPIAIYMPLIMVWIWLSRFTSSHVRSQGIEIERDVWLGAHVGVKDGIKIGAHAVVGMHSMVTKDIESRAIVAGNPARLIRYRD